MKYQREPAALLHIWEFDDAPTRLRRHLSEAHSGGWVAFISPGVAEDLVQELIARWPAPGCSIERHDFRGGVLLAGSPSRL